MKKKLLVVLTVINILSLAHFSVFANRKRVTAVAVGAQSGTVTYGATGSVTYTITLTSSSVTGTQANDQLLLSAPVTPSGVTATLTPNAGTYNATTGDYSPASTTSFTLTITYNATTPAGSYTFSINNTENNAGTSSSTGGTFVVKPTTPTISGAGTGCSITLTGNGGLPSGGTYNWYNVATGGTALATGATYFPLVSGTYYASYTSNSVEGARSTGAAVTLTAGPALEPAPTSPTSSFYLSYPFTGNANDASGNSDNGTLQGSPTLTTDRYNTANSAYNFNGSSQYISTATGEPTPGPGNFSISVWFKTSTAGGLLVGYTASQTGSASQYDRMIYMSNTGTLYFGIYTSGALTINTTTTYADGFWHHAVATCSSTTGSNLYVDGALQATSATMTTPETYTAVGYWRIAFNNLSGWVNPPTDDYFTGSLDDIAVYKSAIPASQVYTLYGAGSAPVCAGNALSLQVNPVSGATYSWTGPLGFSSSSQSPIVSTSATTAMAGDYTCIVTNSGGCSTQIDVTAVVNTTTLPTATFTASSPVYANANSTITYTGTYAATSTYTWDFDGGTIASGTGVGPYTVNWPTTGSKTIKLTVTNSSGCYSSSTQTVVVNSTNFGNYAFSMPLTLKSTSLGISTDLTNFPYLVTITDPSLVYTTGGCSNKVQFPNGPSYDFAFFDAATGAECPYQVESYDQVNGILLVWVKIPTLSHTTNNTLYFNYGAPTAPSNHTTAFYESTWASDYQAVYHFNEASFTGSVADGTANGHTGSTSSGMTSANLVTGKIGNAYSFDGSKSITANAVNITGTFSLSAWINLSSTGHDQKIMTNQASSGSNTGGYKMGIYSDNTIEAESGTAINRTSTPTGPTFATGAWHYVQAVFNGTSLSNYVDGVQCKIDATTNAPTSTNPFYIGVGEGGNQYYFYGMIDEVRVSNVGKTADWVLAEYKNQSAPATYIIQGTITTSFTNASALYGGINYSTADGINYTYTINSATSSGTPPNDGTANFTITGTNVTAPATASIYGLTVNSSDKLDLNGQIMNVGCNIVNNGTITNSSSTASSVVFNGSSSAQSYTGTSGSTGTLDNLTINNSVAGTVTITGGAVTVNKSVTLTSGNLVIDNTHSGALTLASTKSQTAYVAAIPTGFSITGTVAVQRYVTGGTGYRGYRLVSSPVYTNTVSSNNIYSLNYLQNSIYLTGNAGGGFDKTGNPTLYLYREDQTPSNATFTSGNFWGISAINNTPAYNYYLNGTTTAYNLPVGNGMMVFFRGNRDSSSLANETLTSYRSSSATLSASGTLNQGTIVVHSWYAPGSATINYSGTGTGGNFPVRGYNLIGNPYASSIDWSTFSNTTSTAAIYGLHVTPTIWTFDPKTKNYATYNSLTNIATGNGGKIIASGQGFFVLATAASPSLTFKEAAKSNSQLTSGSTLLMSTQSTRASLTQSAYNSYLRLKLVTDTLNYDDMVIGFNSTSSTKFNAEEDSRYVAGMSNLESLAAISSDSIKAAAKWVPFPKNNVNQVIRLNVGAAASGQFTLQRTDLKEIPALYEVWLMDKYKKDSLDIKNNTTYIFDVDLSDTASYGSNRLAVVVRQNPALGVHLLDFTALKATGGSQVVWKTENEYNYTNFTVERSTDGGANYSVIDGLASSSQGTYSFLDKAPVKGANMYRLQITDLNGTISYSSVVTVMYGNTSTTLVKTGVVIYPNPAKTLLNISIASGFTPSNTLTGPDTQAYNVQIANILGMVVQTAAITGQNWQTDVTSLMPGTYVLQVSDKSTGKVVGQGTFIKL